MRKRLGLANSNNKAEIRKNCTTYCITLGRIVFIHFKDLHKVPSSLACDGDSLVVSRLVFYSDGQSSNPGGNLKFVHNNGV